MLVASISRWLFPLAPLHFKYKNGQSSKSNHKADQTNYAHPVLVRVKLSAPKFSNILGSDIIACIWVFISESEIGQNVACRIVGVVFLGHGELSLQQASKTISNRRKVLNPADQGLRHLQILKVNHVSSEKVKR
jgi:hypothetical protein